MSEISESQMIDQINTRINDVLQYVKTSIDGVKDLVTQMNQKSSEAIKYFERGFDASNDRHEKHGKRMDDGFCAIHEDIKGINTQISSLKEDFNEKQGDSDRRITTLETERGTLSKVLNFFLAASTGGFFGWIAKHL